MTWLPYLTMTLLAFVGTLLIFIILLQRGRGGGIAGALGGAGGQSAFGTKAGDVFTKITVTLAIIWVLLAAINVYALRATGPLYPGGDDAVLTAPALKPGEDAATGTAGTEATGLPAGDTATTPAATTPATETPTTATPEATTPAEGTPATPAPAGAATTPAQPAPEQPAAPTTPEQPAAEKPATDPAAPPANP